MNESPSLSLRGCDSDKEHTVCLHPDENWKRYSRHPYLYVNPDDPRIFVMMERGITINLGRIRGWGFLVLMVLFHVTGTVYVDRCYGTGWAGVFALSFSVVLAICAYILVVLGQWLYPGTKGLRPLSVCRTTIESKFKGDVSPKEEQHKQ